MRLICGNFAGNNQKGFSGIVIMIIVGTVLIMGIVAVIVNHNYSGLMPVTDWSKFISASPSVIYQPTPPGAPAKPDWKLFLNNQYGFGFWYSPQFIYKNASGEPNKEDAYAFFDSDEKNPQFSGMNNVGNEMFVVESTMNSERVNDTLGPITVSINGRNWYKTVNASPGAVVPMNYTTVIQRPVPVLVQIDIFNPNIEPQITQFLETFLVNQ